MIDIKAIYLTMTAVTIMCILAIITVKKIIGTRSMLNTILLFVEEIIGAGTLGYLLSLIYQAMDNYEVFVKEHGDISTYFTYISICFCASQIVMIILIKIYVFIKRHSRMIKKRKIIK